MVQCVEAQRCHVWISECVAIAATECPGATGHGFLGGRRTPYNFYTRFLTA